MIRRFIHIILAVTSLGFMISCQVDNNIGKTFYITYHSVDHTSGSVPKTQTKKYGIDISLTEDTGGLIKGDAVLTAWNTARDENGTAYKPGDNYTSDADLSLYPVWGDGYIIKYVSNDSTDGTVPDMQTKREGVSITLASNTGGLSKTGYSFARWNTESDGSGTNYIEDSTYSNDESMTLYAMWYDAAWAKSVEGSSLSNSQFWGSAADNSGNVWAAGYQADKDDYKYSGQTVNGPFDGGVNAVLIKYNSTGNAVWGATPTDESSNGDTAFTSVAVDNEGNSYAAGYISGPGSFTFKTGVSDSEADPNAAGLSAVLVKYDPDGNAIWARTVTGGSADSSFLSVAVYGGYVYAAGYQEGGGSFEYGAPIPASGSSGNKNAVIVKYDTDGTCNWAVTTTAGNFETNFDDIAIDSNNNIYAVGYKLGKIGDTSNFGNGITVDGINMGDNALIVKYEPSAGLAQWAACPTSGDDESYFKSITIDDSDSIYAAGCQYGSTPYVYTSAEATAEGPFSGTNAVIVKYDSSGNPKWAKSPESGSAAGSFLQVATDGTNVWVSGYQAGLNEFSYGSSVSITGLNSGENSIILKYNAEGSAIWGKAAIEAADKSIFNSITVNSMNVFATGYQNTDGDFNYGKNLSGAAVTAAGEFDSGTNSVIVKYVK